MRKTKITALVAGLALLLGACGAPPEEGPRSGSGGTVESVTVFDVRTSSGTVECIFARDHYAGGLSCNW